ncbi:MAG: hypothetical protein WC770_03550 [Phycisphaerae bacterium]
MKDVTVGELIASQQIEQTKAKTVVLDIYTFQIDSARLPEIQNLICQTKTLPIAYNTKDTFSLNGLIACAGDKNDWQKISGPIFQSTPRIAKSTSLYSVEDVSDDVAITQISEPENILYYAGQNKTAGIGLDGGQIMLRIKTSSVIGLLQACKVDIVPIYKGIKSPANQSGGEFVFESAQAVCRLWAGQFVLIAPATVRVGLGESRTLGDVICYPLKPPKTVNIYLINCNQIKEPIDLGGQNEK